MTADRRAKPLRPSDDARLALPFPLDPAHPRPIGPGRLGSGLPNTAPRDARLVFGRDIEAGVAPERPGEAFAHQPVVDVEAVDPADGQTALIDIATAIVAVGPAIRQRQAERGGCLGFLFHVQTASSHSLGIATASPRDPVARRLDIVARQGIGGCGVCAGDQDHGEPSQKMRALRLHECSPSPARSTPICRVGRNRRWAQIRHTAAGPASSWPGRDRPELVAGATEGNGAATLFGTLFGTFVPFLPFGARMLPNEPVSFLSNGQFIGTSAALFS